VWMSSNGRGAVSDRHYLAQTGQFSGRELFKDADVVLAVGTRFVQPATLPWGMQDGQTLIQIDIDPDEVGRNRKPDLGIVGDAKHALAELARRVPAHNRSRDSREDELTTLKAGIAEQMGKLTMQAEHANAIREVMPDGGIVDSESMQVGYLSLSGFPVHTSR